MIRLRILGPPTLEDSSGSDSAILLSHPKRLALLAYLAVNSNGSLARRDTVLGLFWPEQPDARGRHSLNQALHVLRRAVGPGTVLTSGDCLGVDLARLWCDAAVFQQALKAGDAGRALELYRGKLLDGFFAPDCAGFEQWLEETRAAFHARAAQAALAQAEKAATHDDPAALDWARRASDLAPYDEAAARHLISLLVSRGNRTGALETYDRWTVRLRLDLELEASAAMQTLGASIRSSTNGVERVPHYEAPAASPSPSVAVQRAPASAPHRWPLLAVIALALTAGAWSLFGRRAPVPAVAQDIGGIEDRVAVLPFAGAAQQAAIVELLSSRLDGAGVIRAVPADSVLKAVTRDSGSLAPRARTRLAERLRAGSLIEGAVTLVGGRMHVRATWFRAANGIRIAEATAEGEAGHLFAMLDTLAIHLLARSGANPAKHLGRVAALTAPSIGALKAYLEGEAAFAEGRFGAAAHAFERASADTTFALAQYRFGLAALWAEDYPLAAIDAGARALRHAAGLPDRERRLLTAFDAWRTGDAERAATTALDLTASDRDNLEAWFALGETLFHYNPVRGLAAGDARAAFEQVIRLEPRHWGALWHLALLDAMEHRAPELKRRLELLREIGPHTDYLLELATLQACADRDRAGFAALADSLRTIGDGRLTDMIWRCAVYGGDLEGAEGMARLLLGRKGVLYSEQLGRSLIANLDLARGRRKAALAQLDSLAVLNAGLALLQPGLFALPPLSHEPHELSRLAAELRRTELAPPGWRSPDEWSRLRTILLGHLEAALGQPEAALRHASSLKQFPDDEGARGSGKAMAAELRAAVSARSGDSDKALRELESSRPHIWFGFLILPPIPGGLTRFSHAELLERAGRRREALRWYGTLDELSVFDLVLAPLAHLRRGRILEQLGDQAAAAAEYRKLTSAWSEADPELRSLVEEAKQGIARVTGAR
ncbi:MAG TPA: BTAD domain-containing putative transcriptional regulator [Gemmatimonadales bacterium]|nr:BTAD domain-containing putative transcriptional regulator [Gemmatimonadales bacterium]